MKHNSGKSGLAKGVSHCETFKPGHASPGEAKKQQRPKADTSQGPARKVNRSV